MLRNNLFNGLRGASGIINNTLPFNVPSIANNAANISTASSLLKGTSKLSFTSILDNASKTINTINQIVPLYNQVRPMISNAKTALNIFKNVNNPNIINTNETQNSIQNQIKEEVKNSSKKEESPNPTIILNKPNPNKPFFV